MEAERREKNLQANKGQATGFQNSIESGASAYIGTNHVDNSVKIHYSPTKDELTERVILLLPASCHGVEKPSRAREIRQIKRAIRNSHNNSQIKSRFIFNVIDKDKLDIAEVKLSDLLSAINPYIVEMSGFEEGIATLVIEDLENSEISDVNQFVSRHFEINAPEVHCIVLNGCYAESQADNLIRHIDFLIGISQDLPEELVFTFLDEFYYKIGLGWSIDCAYQAGCHKLEPSESDQTKIPFLRNAKQEQEIDLVNKKIEQDPSNIVHWKQKASKLQKIGRYKAAEQAYAKVTSLEPSNPRLREERGDFLEQSGKHEEAASSYKKSSQLLEEKDYKVLWKAGKAYAGASLYSKAANFYGQALDLKPPTPDNYLICREYGYVLEKDNKYKESIAAYKEALTYQPKYRASRYERRWLYQKIYSKKKAIAVQN